MDIDVNIQKEIERHQSQEKSDIDLRYRQICNFFKLCESPLEQMFLFYLLDHDPHRFAFCHTGLDPDYKRHVLMCRSWQLEDFHEFDVKIFAQYVIANNSPYADKSQPQAYRVDFMLELSRDAPISEEQIHGSMAEVYARIIIEVDGHDFHERTKEQAQRDKSRDRYLTKEGYTVFRFTGSEIYKDHYQVGDEVEQVLLDTMLKIRNGEQRLLELRRSGVMKDIRETIRYFSRPYGRKKIRGY